MGPKTFTFLLIFQINLVLSKSVDLLWLSRLHYSTLRHHRKRNRKGGGNLTPTSGCSSWWYLFALYFGTRSYFLSHDGLEPPSLSKFSSDLQRSSCFCSWSAEMVVYSIYSNTSLDSCKGMWLRCLLFIVLNRVSWSVWLAIATFFPQWSVYVLKAVE